MTFGVAGYHIVIYGAGFHVLIDLPCVALFEFWKRYGRVLRRFLGCRAGIQNGFDFASGWCTLSTDVAEGRGAPQVCFGLFLRVIASCFYWKSR